MKGKKQKQGLEKSQKIKVGAGKTLLWQSRAVSLSCNLMMLGFVSIYCTDTLGIPAGIIGTLLMFSKMFDAVTDVLAGYIVDKTNTKWGRGRPYEWCILGVWLCTFIMFSCPEEFSLYAKCAWVLANYVLVNAIFTTFLNAGNNVYMLRAFKHQEQYVALSSYGAIIVMIAAIVVNVTFPQLVENYAKDAAGWQFIIAVFAIPLTLIGLLRFFTIKETNDVFVSAGEKLRLRDVWMALRKNPYFLLILIVMLIYNLVTNMGVNVYYFTYIVGDVGQMGIVAFMQMIAMPLVIVFPRLLKKISLRTLMTVGLAVSATGYLINFFAVSNIAFLSVGSILVGAGAMPINMLAVILILDCCEYNEWKKMPRLEGTLSSVKGFADKVGGALGVGLLGVLLGVAGYTGDIATMPGGALTMIRFLYTLVPAVLYIVLIALFRFYKLDAMMPKIREENEVARALVREKENI